MQRGAPRGRDGNALTHCPSWDLGVSGPLRLVGQLDFDFELALGVRACGDVGAVRAGDGRHDSQAEAVAFCVADPFGTDLLEGPEQPLTSSETTGRVLATASLAWPGAETVDTSMVPYPSLSDQRICTGLLWCCPVHQLGDTKSHREAAAHRPHAPRPPA